MEKTIEIIWKEGFLNKSALLAPQVNKHFNQKSKHIIDKFIRMFKMNLILIVLGSVVMLVTSFIVGIPYMGVPFFFAVNILALINKKLLNRLMLIDKGMSSYEFLMSFDSWLKFQISLNKKFARFFYPFIFLSLVAGLWMKKAGDLRIGDHLVNKLLLTYPDLQLINGFPVIGIIAVLLIAVLLALVGGRIYEWDLKLVYGRIIKKLDEMVADIKELNHDSEQSLNNSKNPV